SSKNSSNEDGNTACVTTASIAFPLVVLMLPQSAKTLLVPILLLSPMVLRLNLRISIRLMKTIWKKWTLNGAWRWFNKSRVECFNCHKMGHFVRKCRAPRRQERGRKESYRQGTKAEEKTPKALMAIDGVGWDWSYMENEGESYTNLSWTGLPEFVDAAEGQNKDSSTSENVASSNPPKPFVKFVKPKDSQPESKSKEQETPKKSQVKYAEQYSHSKKKPKEKGTKGDN
nr:hypothetical protein [Tanacetum cinerariifolium]